jgi:hypothetical protein
LCVGVGIMNTLYGWGSLNKNYSTNFSSEIHKMETRSGASGRSSRRRCGCRCCPDLKLKVGQGDQGSMLWSQFSAIFDNFRRKKLAFFSIINFMNKFLHNLALFLVKNVNFFAKFFGENI